ncbi:MAG TPA: 3-hydroxyacyl-CoA dehydrogenase NAD-binding domain-containing protein [Candidatus Cybelea sp.]|nr:3-hydroxyacyl-CoA dehydrogenase NAD-binding domain-containing protein [Candidatus Cybelea sp.]
MAKLVELTKHGAIGVITVDNPPVNALSPGVPEGIVECLTAGNADPSIKAMVLIGAGRSFIAGADIKVMGTARPVPAKRTYDVLDECTKPVVAAIHGHALGGGLENALACHYRIATRSAKVGLPEVLIGIIPGGGGTQRLPRLIGPKAALDMIVTGRHVPAPEAKALGVLDEVVDDGNLLKSAVAFAEKIAAVRPIPRVGDRNDRLKEANAATFDDMRKKIARSARNQRAPYACIEAVEAATKLPLADGLKREREIFAELVNGAEAKSLRYAFFAEREAAKVPGITKDTAAPEIRSVAVIGGGTMGSGIAMSCADFGIPARVMEASKDALDKAMARIAKTYEVSVQRGSLKAEEMQKRLKLITPAQSYDEIGDADIVIEAVFEDMAVKKEVFGKLDKTMKPGAILASNTSALDVDQIAAATKRPEHVIGTHFFSPANVMKLLEIVKGKHTTPEVIAATTKLAKRIGKIGVVCGNCDGFVANRSRGPFTAEASILIEEGALPQQVDKVLTDFGYPMGPFAVADLAGGDIGYAGRKRRAAADPKYRKLPIADKLVELGRYGQKTGAGWYKYEKGDRTPHPDPEVERIIVDMRRELGINARPISDEEILKRVLFASVNEACKIIGEGIATRASDVDVMWLYGFGFPRYRGGLMHWAEQFGPKAIYAQLLEWEKLYGQRWKPAALLRQLAEQNKTFADASA